jgi:hypothetical protein
MLRRNFFATLPALFAPLGLVKAEDTTNHFIMDGVDYGPIQFIVIDGETLGVVNERKIYVKSPTSVPTDAPDERWYDFDGNYHRDNGPALIRWSGSVSYYKHGLLHREDGPAYISKVGKEIRYCINGEFHRTDGPARIWEHGQEYWVNGELIRAENKS